MSMFRRNKNKGGAKQAAPKARTQRLESNASLPGEGVGFYDVTSFDPDANASDLDIALRDHIDEAELLAEKIQKRANRTDGEEHPTAELEAMMSETYALNKCLFIGHTNTDMDSIASAIGGAALFGGTATRSEKDVNGEIEFACKYAGVELPPYFPEVKGATDVNDPRGICLVDHNEPGQMHKSIGEIAFPGPGATPAENAKANKMLLRIKGIIDHHAVSRQFETPHPLFVDIRPWGSACSIIAHMFVRKGTPIPKKVCIMLLCGILSDTINLTSPTTTQADKVFATLLAFLGEERHPNKLAKEMFKAKTAHLTKLSAYHICRADQKNFDMGDYKVGWATIEVNSPEDILAKSRTILLELRVLKQEKNLDFAFLSVVDLEKKVTVLLLCGEYEQHVAKEVFGGKFGNALDYASSEADVEAAVHHHKHNHDHGEECKRKSAKEATQIMEQLSSAIHLEGKNSLMDIGNKVSRKLEFIPPVKKFLTSGWKPSRQSISIKKGELAPRVNTEHLCVDGSGCTLHRTFSLDENAQEAH